MATDGREDGVVITTEELVALFVRAVDLEDLDRATVWADALLRRNDDAEAER